MMPEDGGRYLSLRNAVTPPAPESKFDPLAVRVTWLRSTMYGLALGQH